MTDKKKFMDLTDKKYPIYMNLVEMAAILAMYEGLDPRIWKDKKRKDDLRPVTKEIRDVWDSWLMQRNKYIQEQIDKKRNNESGLG